MQKKNALIVSKTGLGNNYSNHHIYIEFSANITTFHRKNKLILGHFENGTYALYKNYTAVEEITVKNLEMCGLYNYEKWQNRLQH
jgi:hypothetical protein